jgi:hypothetical protein
MKKSLDYIVKQTKRKSIDVSLLQKLRKKYPNDTEFGANVSKLLLKQS